MKTTPQEIINAIAVSKMGFYKLSEMLEILQKLGSATAIIEHRNNIKDVLPDASDKLIETLKNTDRFLIQAEQEFIWTQNNGVEVLCWGDEQYPQRLKECADAPLTLFYKGSANLNKQRIISIVGTRKCTHYGQDLIKHLIMELQRLCPDVLIVSGLAYGVDINAHRSALDHHSKQLECWLMGSIIYILTLIKKRLCKCFRRAVCSQSIAPTRKPTR